MTGLTSAEAILGEGQLFRSALRANRRSVLAGGAALVATGCATVTERERPVRFGLADITVIRELQRDYAGTVRQVAAMGYGLMGFRLSSYGGPSASELAPAEKARIIRDAGMELGPVRLGVRNASHDADLDAAAAIGAKIVVLSTAPPFIAGPKLFETNRDKFEAWLPQLAAVCEAARQRGLTFAYHNHWYDLLPLGGELPLDLMARAVPPELLAFEVDLAWTWYAGVAPLDLLRRLGSRVVSMHWKDIDRTKGKSTTDHAVVPGAGEMNYPALLPHVVRQTRAPGFVEVDNPGDGLAAARQGAELIKRVLA